MMNYIVSQPNIIAEAGPEDIKGVGNFVIEVQASDSNDTAFNIWMLDSGDYSQVGGISGYDWFYLNQIQWYQNKALEIQAAAGRDTPQGEWCMAHAAAA
jgi:hypothetical protein